ncbi:DUF4942 domain-containing protein [Croceicoccus gelatinilyticus]|uniref:DUF4942 domain-containing protein n=1 Tax=Croceicoccus gelatinilyticus TaxID=2835536 RepID=UPI001BD02F65|nr:DUF4942 domain-containing protein [Croceicoccus gelatinilyticus]MBS7671428.1 DUF4942 domain-containing protein [Croceicoccus gelatinilyticus]
MATAFKAERYTAPENDNLPVQRSTIEDIETKRHRALALYGEAFDLLQQAGDIADKASISGHLPGASYFPREFDRLLHPCGIKTRPERREQFIDGIRKTLDRAIWKHLVEATDIEKLMDAQAREEFRDQLEKDPPEATAENCYTTLANLAGTADEIFMRGIANAFSKLDRRFRSHDGFKIGSRVVLNNALNDYGMWNHYGRKDDVLRDVERTFHVLDGEEQPERAAGIVGAIDAQRSSMTAKAFVAHSDYFEAKVFKNGNVHVWFKRKDLLEEVNRLLATYYGATLGEGADTAGEKAREEYAIRPRDMHAKNFGFFPTSEELARKVLEMGELTSISSETTILEPSAGTGALIEAAIGAGANSRNITAVEIQADLASQLGGLGLGRLMVNDFMQLTPEIVGTFDVVLMNPPFDRSLDCDHVMHAMKFVKPGGKLVAIMAAGVEFRENPRSKALLKRAGEWNAIWYDMFRDLPERSFAHAGTNVNTCVLAIRKPQD